MTLAPLTLRSLISSAERPVVSFASAHTADSTSKIWMDAKLPVANVRLGKHVVYSPKKQKILNSAR